MAAFLCRLALPCKPRNTSLTFLSLSSSSLPPKLLSFSFNLSHILFSKCCLSMSRTQRPIGQSVVCMASRYGSNTRKRRIKSRRKGGDQEKKKKRRRKTARKRKDGFKIIRLVSAEGTGYVYAKRKGKKTMEKLEIMKNDPKVKHHVLFKEAK